MNKPKRTHGHFRSLWSRTSDILIPTTITTQRKNRSHEKEMTKRAQLVSELKQLTGADQYVTVAKSLDGVRRRWNGVKGSGNTGD